MIVGNMSGDGPLEEDMYFGTSDVLVAVRTQFLVVCDSLCVFNYELVGVYIYIYIYICLVTTWLARQLQQECHTAWQVGCSNKEARKRLAQRHLGHMNVVLKWMYLYVDSGLKNWNGYYNRKDERVPNAITTLFLQE